MLTTPMIKHNGYRFFLLLMLCLIQINAGAQERPRIGLVLSGGGARGIAHIGVLKVLEEMRIPIDAIAATSMGAVVGGGYAAGISAADMENLVTSLNWADLFSDKPARALRSNRRKQDDYKRLSRLSIGFRNGELLFPQGVISGQKMEQFLRELIGPARDINDFDQLPIPFRAVATDLVTGEMVVFETGELDVAMRSSMSVPGVIAPLPIGDKLLVDGGLVRNLPVDIARQMDVDVLIAVNLGTPLLKRESLNSAFGVTAQMLAILTEQNVQNSIAKLGPGDILILPQLDDISAADFGRAAEAVAIGEAAARRHEKDLRRFSLSRSEYERWRGKTAMPPAPPGPVIVDEIRFTELKHVNPKRMQALMLTRPGQEMNTETLKADIARIYGTGDFERIGYRISREQDRNVLLIEAVEKSWGPNFLRFGIDFKSDFQGNAKWGLLANYNQTWVNENGAEWQTDLQFGTNLGLASEFYHPLGPDSPWFIAPYIDTQKRLVDIFNDSDKIAKYDIASAAIGIDFGIDLQQAGEVRVGLEYGGVDARPNTGSRDLPKFDGVQGALTASYIYDQLDNLNFPRTGDNFIADLYLAREFLGSDVNYSKLEGQWNGAFSRGKNTISAGVNMGGRLDGNEIPVYDEFTLGGFLNLSGYQNDQLRGQFMGLARLVFYREIANLGGNLGGTVFLGGSVEAGNVWEDSDDISLSNLQISASAFVGADTLLGPLYLGYGVSEKGDNSAYFFIGRP